MRRAPATVLFVALAALLALVPSASAQELAGTWELSWDGPQGTRTTTFVFAVEGMNVTGTAQMRRGENTMEVPVSNGMLHGDQLTFSLELRMGERTMIQTFAATVKGDAMEGKITTPQGERPFTGKRKQG